MIFIIRRCVRRRANCSTFFLVESLPSSDSADASTAPLFAVVVSTTDSCDLPLACMSDLPSETFPDRSESCDLEANGLSRFSRLKYCCMLRFSDSAALVCVSPVSTHPIRPSPCEDRVGTRECGFRSSMAGLLNPPHGRLNRNRFSAGGRSEWLVLLRRTLSFPISTRFIPALPHPIPLSRSHKSPKRRRCGRGRESASGDKH